VRGGLARKAFVVAEIALAVALVMGAGLLGRSLVELARVDMGFASERLAVLRTTVPVAGPDEFVRATATYRALLEDVRALPGVASAGAVTSLPSAPRSNGGYWIEGAPGPEVLGIASPQALFTVITPGYFDALGVAVVRGRDVGDGDRLRAGRDPAGGDHRRQVVHELGEEHRVGPGDGLDDAGELRRADVRVGLDPERVRLMPTSTEKNCNTSATAASASTDLNGAAAVRACQQIKRRLKRFAADRLASGPRNGLFGAVSRCSWHC